MSALTEFKSAGRISEGMRILFDIVHPADVHFFKHAIAALTARGDKVRILSRHKDITCELLDEIGLDHTPVSRAASGQFGLARELMWRDLRMLREVVRFRPDVMVGFGGVAVSHVGKVTRTPSVAFYDTETAKLQNSLTWPFITALYVPRCYSGRVPKGRTFRVPGLKPLAFLHPENFTPDRQIAIKNGLDPDRENYLVRLVSWQAHHDIGHSGWRADETVQLVEFLSTRGQVIISSEAELPESLKSLAYRGERNALHHLMGHCDLCIGESVTMAAEAGLLGARAVFVGAHDLAAMRELHAAGIAVNVVRPDGSSLVEIAKEALTIPQAVMQDRVRQYLADAPNWADEVIAAIDRHAKIDRTVGDASIKSQAFRDNLVPSNR